MCDHAVVVAADTHHAGAGAERGRDGGGRGRGGSITWEQVEHYEWVLYVIGVIIMNMRMMTRPFQSPCAPPSPPPPTKVMDCARCSQIVWSTQTTPGLPHANIYICWLSLIYQLDIAMRVIGNLIVRKSYFRWHV